MSGYYDEEPRRRSHRSRRPVYEEEVIQARSGRNNRGMDLVRRRDSDDSIEEVRRDFPPENAYIQRRYTTRDKYAPRARSDDRSHYDDYDRRSNYSRRNRYDSKSYPSDLNLTNKSGRRYDSESDSDYSPSPPRHRRKSLGEQALSAVGLGGAASALSGDRGRSKSRNRSRSRRYSRSRSRSEDNVKKLQQAAKAAVTAGAIEAWRSRKEPGGLAGQGKRFLTAAVGAAGTSGVVDNDPNKNSKRHTIESVIGGLASNHLINGPRESSRSRSRSRSRGRGGKEKDGLGAGGVASAAAIAGLAGKAFQNYREKSRGRGRRGSSSSDDGRRPKFDRKRSKSVSEFVTRKFDKGMAALGLGESEFHRPEYKKDKYGRRHFDDDDDDAYVARPRGGGAEERSSSTDSYDTDEELKKQKKMRGKEFLTAGLATIATIHAVHGVHSSMEAGKVRHKKVMEGRMSTEEARRLKSKAILQDAAAVGIAALGVKGTISEWKEVNEQRHQMKESKNRLAEKRERRRQKLLRNGSHHNSEPNLGARYQCDDSSRYDHQDGGASRYADGNPYASSSGYPPPPMSSRY